VTSWFVKSIDICPESDELVDTSGRIVKVYNYWAVHWTEVREGYQEVTYKYTSMDPVKIATEVSELMKRLRAL
jgi:hypothetical protein